MKRVRIEFLLVALACLGPLVAAYVFYYYGDLSSLPRTQNEDRLLVNPAVPLPPPGTVDADGPPGWGPEWTLLYVRTSDCDDACRAHLVRLAQVHAALGRDQDRVRRVYLGPDGDELASTDSTLSARSVSGSADTLLETLTSAAAEPGDGGRVYVVDPHGNLVLSYPPDAEQRGLLEDLERLLDVSQIG